MVSWVSSSNQLFLSRETRPETNIFDLIIWRWEGSFPFGMAGCFQGLTLLSCGEDGGPDFMSFVGRCGKIVKIMAALL